MPCDQDAEWLKVARQTAASAELPYALEFGLVLTLDSLMSESERRGDQNHVPLAKVPCESYELVGIRTRV